MDIQKTSAVGTSLHSEAVSRRRMKPTPLVFGISAVAVLGTAAVLNWESVQSAFGTAIQEASAAVGVRQVPSAEAAAEPAREIAAATNMPTATAVDSSGPSVLSNSAERSPIVSTAPTSVAEGVLSVGDRLKIAFYERVDVEEDKWGRMGSISALRGILQRPELSGEYIVQEDGTISVPMLGSVPAAQRLPQQVRADLMEAFDQLLGRKGIVNIVSLERSPIYVLGPVKNPGSFKYVPGMTVLHAIALAGGLDRGASEPWQKIEAVREIHKRSGAVEAMLRLLARVTVLKAERDGTEPKIPLRMLELVDATEATSLINEQSDRRKPVAAARKNREHAMLTGLESAKQDVAVFKRMEALDELFKLRQERVNNMRALVDRNVLSMTVLNQAQSELTDAEQRRRDALNQYAQAKQRLATTEAETLRVQADLKNDLEVEIETIERQVADYEREFNTSESVLSTLPATRAQFAKEAKRVSYQVVRQTGTEPKSVESTGMTLLQPGDLVNIIVGDGEPKEQAGSPVLARPQSERLPAGRSAKTGPAVADQGSGPK
jgi:polysaccharide biosynthesis/export protein ExoF